MFGVSDRNPSRALGLRAAEESNLGVGCIGGCDSRQGIRKVEASHSDPVVSHAVIDVESVRQAEIGAAVDAGGKDDVGDGPQAFLRQFRSQHGLVRAITDVARMLDGEH